MNKILNRTSKLIFAKQGGMLSSALILSVMIIVSRLFGFLRYRVLAGYFMKGDLDVFFAAFRIPDIVFEILITGAFTSTFIPIFVRYIKNQEELEINISSIMNLITIFLVGFIIITVIFLDYLMPVITPGFSKEKMDMVISYSRLLLIGQLPFLVFGNFLTGIAQANKIFFITSIAPIIYNISVIAASLLFAQSVGLTAPIIGIIFGAILFFIIQLPIMIKVNFHYHPIINITKGVSDFFRTVLPRTFSVIFSQIDATVDLTLASFLGSGSYTIFYLAQHLQLLPVSIIGMAFGQASLPYLSELFEEKKMDELKKVIIDSLLNLLYLTIPIASFFAFARTPLVRLFFGGEKFDWEATVQTATTLSFFCFSLPFHSIYYFITRCFYSLLDTKTPFVVSLFSVGINTLLSVYFILYLHLPVSALAISFSISVIFSVTILMIIINNRLAGLEIKYAIIELGKILLATLIASIISYSAIRIMDGLLFDTTRTINIFFILSLSVLIFSSIYFFLSWIFDIKEFYLVGRLLLKIRAFQKQLVEIYTSYE